MKTPVLQIRDLSVEYNDSTGKIPALHSVNIDLHDSERIGIIGESGSGKSTLAFAILKLLGKNTACKGSIKFNGEELIGASQEVMNRIRWSKIALVFQNGVDILNPVLTVEEQIAECITRHTRFRNNDVCDIVCDSLEMVGLDPGIISFYPHQLSGGMRQKVLIAMAVCCKPEVLIVDEPVSSLDSIAKKQILDLLLKLHGTIKTALIVISHDITTISSLTENCSVLYNGCIVEQGPTNEIIKEPIHPYTRGLMQSSPIVNPYRDLWGIQQETYTEQNDGCPFFLRCSQKVDMCKNTRPKLNEISSNRKIACNRNGIITRLECRDITKEYDLKGKRIHVLDKVCIQVKAGETVVLTGKSGSGKSTLAHILASIIPADHGEVFFEGTSVSGNALTSKKHGIQIVFQDPFSSINEHFSVLETIREPLDIQKDNSKEERKSLCRKMLEKVSLPSGDIFLARKCHTLSGGQRQRVAIARALIMEPKVLIADEICSMLDSSTQANILRLLKGLQNSLGFSMLYITHDFAVARKIADRLYTLSNTSNASGVLNCAVVNCICSETSLYSSV